jgi:peptide deformylase
MRQVITVHPSKDLFRKADDIPIKNIQSDTFTQIGSSMLEILRKKGGIGLSANQVGLPFNLCVIELTSSDPKIMINPRVVKQSDKMVKSTEGCLSLPGATVVVNRHATVVVEYEDVTGETISLDAEGLLSNCLQHEIDHLKGVLMINRVGEIHRSRALKAVYRFKKAKGYR